MQKHRMWIRRVSSKENSTRSRFTKCVLNGKREILNLSHEEGGGLSDGWGAWKGPGPGGGNLTCWLHAPWDSQVQWCRRQSDPKDQIQRVTIGNESWGFSLPGRQLEESWASNTFPRTRMKSMPGLLHLLPCSPGQWCSIEHTGLDL